MPYFEFRDRDAFELLARDLETHPDYRVLRRLPRYEEIWLRPSPKRHAATVIGVLDTETTGLDPTRDKMIELAIVKMTLDDKGMLADITQPMIQVEDPGFSLPPQIEQITGLTDGELYGQAFDERLILSELDDVDALCAFNAPFDRGFMVQRFPQLGHPWMCAAREVDWAAMGLQGRALGHLLASAGHHHHAHRAGPDTWALACLLAMHAPDRRPVLAHLLDAARKSTRRLYAKQAPFSCREALKAGGYRWDGRLKAWWIEADEERIANEAAYLVNLHPLIRPEVDELDWFTRHVT